jgi:hypothetical protein
MDVTAFVGTRLEEQDGDALRGGVRRLGIVRRQNKERLS